MESILKDYILDFQHENNILSNKQHGFLPGRSTILQLLNVLDKWTEAINNDRCQGKIQKKSASSSQMLPFVIFDKKALFAKSSVTLMHFCVISRHFWVKLHKNALFEHCERCPEILNYTVIALMWFIKSF